MILEESVTQGTEVLKRTIKISWLDNLFMPARVSIATRWLYKLSDLSEEEMK